jgi:TolB-like protein
MRMSVRAAMALLSLAVFTPAIVQAQAKPVIAVLYFDNNSIGKDHADYDGVGKGIADILITDMASNPNIRIVERERIQSLLVEQNLTREKTIDPQTAIRLGKIIGAQYMITGGFLSDGKGTFVLTARAINVETSAISNPQRLTSRGDDVLGLIAQLSNKVNNEMKLQALQVGEAVPAGQPAETKVAEAKPAEAKPAEHKAQSPEHKAAKSNKKMDMKTVMLLSKALEEEDAGNRTKAVELYRQVVDKFPDYAPAQQKLKRLSQS